MLSMAESGDTIFSFIVDDDPIFVYEGWHLARSLIEHCNMMDDTSHLSFY
jgi:hypothetical protein